MRRRGREAAMAGRNWPSTIAVVLLGLIGIALAAALGFELMSELTRHAAPQA
jgi:hypothetical protein